MGDIIAAGIVLYNPDIARLKENINAVITQTDMVVMVDNGSDNRDEIKKALAQYENIYVMYSKTNKGIAWALNRIFDKAVKKGAKWVLTLDQDSVCPADMVGTYCNYIENEDGNTQTGIVCPVIVDEHMGVIEGTAGRDEAVKRCITSGSMTLCEGWSRINGFDEKMFIDGVDFDYCDRLREAGYRIVRLGNVSLDHELGNMTEHRFFFLRVKLQNHSAKRKYYIVRNRFYLCRKQRKPLAVAFSFLFVFKFLTTIILYEEDKYRKTKAVLRGMRDGLRMKI